MSGFAVKVKNVCVASIPTFGGNVVDAVCSASPVFGCVYYEKVFASDDPEDYKKDKTDFLFRKLSPSDSLVIELYKYGVKVADITDDSLGEFYNGFTAQLNYIGWLADWTLIFNQFSGGCYQVKVQSVIAGEAQTFESRFFLLNKYYPEIATRTVKMEVIQTGNIVGSDLDYTDLLTDGWFSSIRIEGTFGKKEPTLEIDKYETDSYELIQNREQVTFSYLLETDPIPQQIADLINEQHILGNEIFITDYDLSATFAYRKLPVAPVSYDGFSPLGNGQARYNITFTDRVQNNIKRNF